jgi:uncharacterized protein DUF4410
MKRVAGALALGAAALLLSACGGSRDFRVEQPPSEAFASYGALQVQPFTIEEPRDAVVREKALKMAELLTNEVRDRLAGRFDKGGRTLVVQGRLVGFDPGSQAARYWVGFGAGEGSIVAEVTFLNESGKAVAKGAAWGTVSGGWFGGSLNSAGRRVAKAVVDFVNDNYDAVTSVPSAAPR